jgi:hypothetical protein
MQTSPSPSVVFVGYNSGIGLEGWVAVGRSLSFKRNIKKLDLGEERGNASSADLTAIGLDDADLT